MGDKSADEVLFELVAKFGDVDGFLVHRLTNSVSQLALQWRVFLYFYCGAKERVDVLNEASGFVSKIIQDTLWDNAILTIRRLTDPEESGKDTNVSLKHLLRIAGQNNELERKYDDMVECCRNSRRYASKLVAHSDLKHAAGKKTAATTRGETTKAVKSIILFVQEFHLLTRDTDYQLLPITTIQDEQQFLHRLHQGNGAARLAEKERREALQKSDYERAKGNGIPEWIYDAKARDEPF